MLKEIGVTELMKCNSVGNIFFNQLIGQECEISLEVFFFWCVFNVVLVPFFFGRCIILSGLCSPLSYFELF